MVFPSYWSLFLRESKALQCPLCPAFLDTCDSALAIRVPFLSLISSRERLRQKLSVSKLDWHTLQE